MATSMLKAAFNRQLVANVQQEIYVGPPTHHMTHCIVRYSTREGYFHINISSETDTHFGFLNHNRELS